MSDFNRPSLKSVVNSVPLMQSSLNDRNDFTNTICSVKPKLKALTSLRFMAAAMIVIHHSKGIVCLSKDFLPHVVLGQGVSFFFVLSGLVYINPLGRLFEFVLGMCGSLMLDRFGKLRLIGSALASVYEVVFLLLIALSMTVLSYVDVLIKWIGQTGAEYLIHSGTGVFFAGFIVIVATQKGMLSRILSNSIFVFLGEISYSIYLFHQILIRYYTVFLVDRFPKISDAVLYLLFWIILLAFSAFIWKCIERPGRHFLRQLLSEPVRESNKIL